MANIRIIPLLLSMLAAGLAISCHEEPQGSVRAQRASQVAEHGLLAEAVRELGLMRSSTYQHRTEVDEKEGSFSYDCSGLLCYALGKVSAAALEPIPHPDHVRPLAEDFHDFFGSLPTGASSGPWRRVDRVEDLEPGDIIAWLKPPGSSTTNTGHVMIVREVLSRQVREDELLVRVVDSTQSPHGCDSRRKGETGLGCGVIGLVAASGRPTHYYWSGGESKTAVQTSIRLGRWMDPQRPDPVLSRPSWRAGHAGALTCESPGGTMHVQGFVMPSFRSNQNNNRHPRADRAWAGKVAP